MRPPLIPQTIPIHDQDSKMIKLLKTLFNSLVEYREPKTGRIIVSLFMCLPSRKDFPEYFNIISKPISMYEIRKRIETNHYTSEESFFNDFKLMFNNCRTFNEDGSIIFEDSNRLEKIIQDKYNELRPSLGSNGSKPTPTVPKSAINNVDGLKTPNKTNNHHHQHHHHHHHHHQTNNRNHHVQNHHHQHFLEKNHFNSSVGNNLISQSSNGFPSEDSNSNSNNFSASLMNEDSLGENSFHNDMSMDSNSSFQDRPTKRSKRDHDLPKKRVLTGYIIYAAEVRKEYVDKNPNQDFGFISRLIGNDWKALPKDLKQKYEQRAFVQNAQLAKETARLEQIRASTPTATSTPLPTAKRHRLSHVSTISKPIVSTTTTSAAAKGQFVTNRQPPTFSEVATQTAPARFVEPPKRMHYNYTEIFRRYLGEELEITAEDVYATKTDHNRKQQHRQNGDKDCNYKTSNYNHHLHNSHHLDADSTERWLGAGIGRHRSSADALWALRDFMLQDATTMRWSLQPYQLASSQEDDAAAGAVELPQSPQRATIAPTGDHNH